MALLGATRAHSLAFIMLLALPASVIAAPERAIRDAALLVLEEDETALAETLAPLMSDEDAQIRTIAARLVAARNLPPLLPALREALEREDDAVAAREQVRAIVLTGGADHVEFVRAQIERFDGALDGALASAMARLGGAVALDLYFSHARELSSLGDSGNYFELALWGSPEPLARVASRLVAEEDERGWKSLVRAHWQSDRILPVPVAVAAMQSRVPSIRREAAWGLAQTLSCEGQQPGCRSDFPHTSRLILFDDLRRDETLADVELRFGRELLRRVFALDREEPSSEPDAALLEWLATDDAESRLRSSRLMKYLNERERQALGNVPRLPGSEPPPNPEIDDANRLTAPPFDAPAPLPPGVADALATPPCRGSWIGLSSVQLDARGRVASATVDPFFGSRACRKAVEAMIRLSFPMNRSMSSPRAASGLVTLKARAARTMCLDEPPPDVCATCAAEGEALRFGPGVEPPKVRQVVDPIFTDRAKRTMTLAGGKSQFLTVEAIITREGCVRSPRLLVQTPVADLNTSALQAVSQWTFEPGRLNGEPVNVIFNLTVNFELQ